VAIEKKSIEDLKNQAQWFFDYADSVWLITYEEKGKLSKVLWIWESDKKWFFDRLFKRNNDLIRDEKIIWKRLTKGTLLKKWVFTGEDFSKLWDEYNHYLKAKNIIEKYVSLPEITNNNLIEIVCDNIDDWIFLKNFKIMMESWIYNHEDWVLAVESKNYHFDCMCDVLISAKPKVLQLMLEKFLDEDFDTLFNDDMEDYYENMNYESLAFLLWKFPQITIDQLLELQTDYMYDSNRGSVFDFYPNITLDEFMWICDKFWFKILFKYRNINDFLNFLCSERRINVENFKVVFNHYKSLVIDKLWQWSHHSDRELFINDDFDAKAVKLVFKKYPNISPSDLEKIWSIPFKNLRIIFNEFSNKISFEQLLIYSEVFKKAHLKNLKYIINEYYDDFKIADLDDFDDIIGDRNFSKVLKLIKNKYNKNLPYDDLKQLWWFFDNDFFCNLKYLFNANDLCRIDDIKSLSDVLFWSTPLNFEIAINNYSINDLELLSDVLSVDYRKFNSIFKKYWKITIDERNNLSHILNAANTDNLELILNYFWQNFWDIKSWTDGLNSLETILSLAKPENLKLMLMFFNPSFEDLNQHQKAFLFKWKLLENTKFKEDFKIWYLDYIENVMDLWVSRDIQWKILCDIFNLDFCTLENYLKCFNDYCITKNYPYSVFFECFDWESLNLRALKLLDEWFELPNPLVDGNELFCKKDDVWFLNNSIKLIYPDLDVIFNREETKLILDFVDSVWWINKWYTILVLTIEKMVRDWVDSNNFSNILCKKIRKYKKIFDIYPENKIPEWLKISVWMEFEITNSYAEWYNESTWNDYLETVNKIIEISKWWRGCDWVIEFATKPSTNPMVALLEIHLLQELNLLDINDMEKLSLDNYGIDYKSRIWTWYHLNIWSDSDIFDDDENINFIQNLCSLLPRSWISNWWYINEINYYGDLNIKYSYQNLFPKYSSTKDSENSEEHDDDNCTTYIEFRTYSVDDVELFEKNVLFNCYAVMWNQAQNLVSNVTNNNIVGLQNDNSIRNQDDLMKFLENNNLFNDNQNLKSKKIAVEFIYMQLCVLRAINYYNHNFIDDELFWKDLIENLSEPRKNFFFDLLLSDNKETMWFGSQWLSSLVVKKYTNLDTTFDAKKYIEKIEPFSDIETKKILNETWNDVAEKRISYVTTWLNKQLLWQFLSNWDEDTQDLQDKINNKVSNIDRIKSYIWSLDPAFLISKSNDPNLKINRQYLEHYFKINMSLNNFDPYDNINLDFMNTIININNFFLKKDDTNANWVLQKTILDWKEEPDISKLSIFETWYMRKWYNYYQWWTEDMLLHSVQKIALDYMYNVKNILNNDSFTDTIDLGYKNVA